MTPTGSAALEQLAAVWRRVQPGLDVHVDPSDDIFRYAESFGLDPIEALANYLALGSEIVGVVDQALRACGVRLDGVASLLDCGSGHGRSTRFLVHRVDPRRITVCDRVAAAADFQRVRFGVAAASSVEQLGSSRFEVILSISLFSNLPQGIFVDLLRELVDRLTPGGVLILTTQPSRGSEDFVYCEQSESSVLGTDVYGDAQCSARWFERTARSIQGVAFVRHASAALNGVQDVWAIGREAGRGEDAEALPIEPPPRIHVDRAHLLSGGHLDVEGWALDARRRPVAALEIAAGDALCEPARVARPDVATHFGAAQASNAGFSTQLQVGEAQHVEYVMVTARDSGGRAHVAVARTRPS